MDPTSEFLTWVAAQTADPVSTGAPTALDRPALLIAAHARPSLNVDDELSRLDELAADFGGGTADDLVRWIGGLGFRGNHDDYYDPRNSYLDVVLDRRLGIPITLSLLVIEVGRRVGIGLYGVGLPGEFIVGETDRPGRFHNPFRHESMDADGVAALLRRLHGRPVAVAPEMLGPVGSSAFLSRVLTNLAIIFSRSGDVRGELWALRLRASLPGVPPSFEREFTAAVRRLKAGEN